MERQKRKLSDKREIFVTVRPGTAASAEPVAEGDGMGGIVNARRAAAFLCGSRRRAQVNVRIVATALCEMSSRAAAPHQSSRALDGSRYSKIDYDISWRCPKRASAAGDGRAGRLIDIVWACLR